MGRQLEIFEIEACARAAHEMNRAYCQARQDFSHLAWESVSDDLKVVARQAVIGIVTQDHNAEQSHAAWMTAKRAQGWTYGPKKNAELKQHPCLVPWKDLPFEEQVKDELWITSTKALLRALLSVPNQ